MAICSFETAEWGSKRWRDAPPVFPVFLLTFIDIYMWLHKTNQKLAIICLVFGKMWSLKKKNVLDHKVATTVPPDYQTKLTDTKTMDENV